MKGYLVLVGNMAESLADENLFSACTPLVLVSEDANFNALIALELFLEISFQENNGPTVSKRWPIEFHGSHHLLPEYLKTGVDLSSGAALEIKVVQVKIETL